MSQGSVQRMLVRVGKDRFVAVSFEAFTHIEDREQNGVKNAELHYLEIRDAAAAVLTGEAEVCHDPARDILALYES
jgi:hypothetical protein